MDDVRHRALVENSIERDRKKAALHPSVIGFYAAIVTNRQTSVVDAFREADETWNQNNREDALCRGTKSEQPLKTHLLRVMKLDVFIEYNTDHAITQTSSKKYRDLLANSPELARRAQTGPLRGDRNVFWMTLSSALSVELIEVPEEELADSVRSVIGLLFPANAHLIVIDFPPLYFDAVWIPTFVDGGSHAAFRNWEDESEGVGYTWNLLTQARGVPEVVSKNYILDDRASVSYVGKTSRPAPLAKVM